MEQWVPRAGSLPLRTCREDLSDTAKAPKSFLSYKTRLRQTHLQVQFPCGQYDMFSSRLLERLYAWISLTEQPHPTNELGHIGWYHGLQGHSYNGWGLEQDE
jgi:hypothetical protein